METGKPLLDEAGKPIKVTVELQKPQVFNAVVFNAHQITGLPESSRDAIPKIEAAEKILSDSGATLIHQPGDRAFYSASTDAITLPLREQFLSAGHYYSTALHELGHWTGHESRLNRDMRHPFGSEGYAKEELRAEIASMMIGEELAIGHDPGQHVAYIGSWISALQQDPRELFRAAADAEKIHKYVLSLEKSKSRKMSLRYRCRF